MKERKYIVEEYPCSDSEEMVYSAVITANSPSLAAEEYLFVSVIEGHRTLRVRCAGGGSIYFNVGP